MNKQLDASWAIQAMIASLAGIAVLTEGFIIGGEWTWIDYAVIGGAICVSIGAVMTVFLKARRQWS
uniref:Uncharacterized protein n=1 Tax=Candidatus Kentrum sp. SD TaxID=2126332 RepID=A0A450YIH8_9GAMM|nr:MAG: hypothetical protein BECKSD772F_GA0070984_101740 [Candidatus Kentron sp. SD]VFK41344.1 MAG: hypothetical protein BECKSD772E_GA0070983_101135 [Candidatus Kentron sp. SD]VFK80111.1 MAG: hypothetical protein BECKSD772D_GA0070982_108510 [Candidatus Kentron sp. SD]